MAEHLQYLYPQKLDIRLKNFSCPQQSCKSAVNQLYWDETEEDVTEDVTT